MAINTGFSWVRIDKGTFHCNFRYLNQSQVRLILNYLQSYYAYRNISFGVVDLGPLLPDSDGSGKVGDHYRPYGSDPNQDYYYLVELHRHGTIIPQGCIELMKIALNSLAQHTIIPDSVFIEHLGSDVITVDDVKKLHAIVTSTTNWKSGETITWGSSDPTIIFVEDDPDDPTNYEKCQISALSPGVANITASVIVEEMPVILFDTIPKAAGGYVAVDSSHPKIYQYTGPTRDYYGKTFQQNNYYECVWNNSSHQYEWVDSDFDGSPIEVTYTDEYIITVRTFVKITTKEKQRLCLYHYLALHADTPSVGLTINWQSSTEAIGFDPTTGSTGPDVNVVGSHTGSGYVKAAISDAYGTYMDEMPLTIYGVAVTPKEMKVVIGHERTVSVKKEDIFYEGEIYAETPAIVNWATSSETIASVTSAEVSEVDLYAKATIVGNTGGVAYVTALAEDPTDGQSYQDSVKVTVGNVAINTPASTTIWLQTSATLTLTADMANSFDIAVDGWSSSNINVITVGTPSQTEKANDTVVITGIAEGSALITVTATSGLASDTDKILIKVVDREYVTEGEMRTFTHGLFNKHGYIDWEQPTGEEGTLEVPDGEVELATNEEVSDFVDDLFTPENEESMEEPEESTEESSEESTEEPSEESTDGE